MLAGEPAHDNSWKMERIAGGYRLLECWRLRNGSREPWHVEFRDARGRLLTKTDHTTDNASSLDPLLPFSFIRRSSDYSRSVDAVFTLSPNEKLFGCGESFTRLDKRGQKVVLWSNDANGSRPAHVQADSILHEQPRLRHVRPHLGAGTFDFGASYSGANSLMLGDDDLDCSCSS